MVSTPTSAVKLDVGALEAPLRAKMKLAQAQGGLAAAIGQVGQVAGDFGMKLQQAKNFGVAADADRQMRQAWEDFHSSLAGRTDEENWTKDWQAKSQAVKDSVYSQHKPAPDLKAQLDNNFANWQQSTAIEAKTVAHKQMINRTVERADLAADKAAQSYDESGVKNSIKPLITLGAVTPERGAAMIEQKLNKMDEYAAKNYIVSNPVDATDTLEKKNTDGKYVNYPKLDQLQRNSLIREARATMHAYQSANLDSTRDALDSGKVGADSEKYIQNLVTTKAITARGAENLRTYIAGKNKSAATETYNLLNGDVIQWDSVSDQDPAATAASLREDASTLPTVYRNHILRAIDSKVNAAKSKDAKAERPVHTFIMGQMRKDFEEGFMLPGQEGPSVAKEGTGIFGTSFFAEKMPGPVEFADPGMRTSWQRLAPEAERDAATQRYAQNLAKMDDWLKEHPKATYQEADAFRKELVKPYLMEQVGKAINPPSPSSAKSGMNLSTGSILLGTAKAAAKQIGKLKNAPENVTEKEYAALKPGDSYFYEGKEYKKR